MTATTLSHTVALYTALHEAIDTGTALHVLYATNGDLVKARTIRPQSIQIGPRGSDLVYADDSLRGRVVSLRIDRFVAWGAGVAEGARS